MKRPVKTTATVSLAAAALFILWPRVALANAGLPMLFIMWPAAWVSFVPVVLVEAWIARRVLETPWPRSLRVATLANAVSTIVGIPITWVMLTVAEFVTFDVIGGRNVPGLMGTVLSAPWLGPSGFGEYWRVPLAAALLCVPFALASVAIEGVIAGWTLAELPRARVRRWAWVANAGTYGLLFVAALIWLVVSLVRGHL